jgi:hypothetical protein
MSLRDMPESVVQLAQDVKKSIPVEGVDRTIRRELNEVVREYLPGLPVDALTILALGSGQHQLSQRELRRRLECGLVTDLPELFRMLDRWLDFVMPRSLFPLILKTIVEQGRHASIEDLVILAHDFRYSRMHRDVLVMQMIARARSDGQVLFGRLQLPGSM